MTPHALYESHYTLAITGQLSPQLTSELLAHCEACPTCRERVQQLDRIQATLLLHSLETCAESTLPSGALDRFRVRAIANHIPLQSSSKITSLSILAPAFAAMMAFVMVLSFLHATATPKLTAPNVASRYPTSSQPTVYKVSSSTTSTALHHGLRRSPRYLATAVSAQQATLAPERFQHTAPILRPYFKSPTVSTQTVTYPSLSSDQIRQLSLFHAQNDVPGPPTFGLAALHLPANVIAPDQRQPFAPNLERLRFILPSQQ